MHTPLIIKNTRNCQDYPWHPSVVYAKEGWNGHRWWMAQTPFPPFEKEPYRDRFELPCVHFSDDGIKWEPIPGNPLEDLFPDEIESHNYYSDPHLVFVDGKLELYYRFTFLKERQLIDNKTLLLKRSSTDGIHWSDRTIIADLRKQEDVDVWGDQIISQAIVLRDGEFRCYYVDRSSYLRGRRILFTESKDGENWSQYRIVELKGAEIDPWHIDVQFYYDKYQMIVYDDGGSLFWFESEDGTLFQLVSEVLRPSKDRYSFYADGLYRACSVRTDDDARVFFSAKRKDKTYIGQLQTNDRHHFNPVNGMTMVQWLPIIWKPLMKTTINRLLK